MTINVTISLGSPINVHNTISGIGKVASNGVIFLWRVIAEASKEVMLEPMFLLGPFEAESAFIMIFAVIAHAGREDDDPLVLTSVCPARDHLFESSNLPPCLDDHL